jgi:hypothetical protein
MAVAVGPRHPDRGRGGGGPEVALVAEEFVLCLLLEDRGDLEDMGGGERQGPAGGGATARDLGHDAVEGRQAEGVPAVPARLQHPVETGAQELLVGVLGVDRQPLGLRLPFEQRGPHRHGPLDHFAFGEFRFGNGDHGAS